MSDPRRLLAACEQCGSVYAAKRLHSGAIRPIGTARCACGCKRFTKFE